ncbi:hypothetical protein HWQ46_19245 [Shewanella sp. D64]|uniref:hypothetical protein n=1 Tax=unclassified Shewanella TaxID=196818 RepID=UPI0022BA3CB4|nr:MULTISPECIES: hypothetical protein [unclassified Shewanella]MEC4727685.1 hypothetical protein [Shewanella sp. D64]MEC4739742.1 hypothetical protein [Shewanella sp. E94]WBJ94081.1 hypothetical protein HWQ47_19560 [Shewanella sp. MTB7]
MSENTINRRNAMKLVGNVTAAGIVLSSTSVRATSALLSKDADTASLTPEEYIVKVLSRKFANNKQVTLAEIRLFSQGYIQHQGKHFDPKESLKSPLEELTLMREFVVSVKYRAV